MATPRKKQSLDSFLYQLKLKGFNKNLEISSYSSQDLGNKLSAFILSVCMEDLCQQKIYIKHQKKFEYGGPYIDLLYVTPLEAKRNPRLKNSERIVSFVLNKEFPTIPLTSFYNYIYIRGLLHNENLLKEASHFTSFTDFASTDNQVNSQAFALAIAVYLFNNCDIKMVMRNYESFVSTIYKSDILASELRK